MQDEQPVEEQLAQLSIHFKHMSSFVSNLKPVLQVWHPVELHVEQLSVHFTQPPAPFVPYPLLHEPAGQPPNWQTLQLSMHL